MSVPPLQPGQAYRLKATHANAWSRAANAHDARSLGGGAEFPRTQWQGDVRLIKNDSGFDCDAGDALAIADDVVVTPEDVAIETNFLRWGPQLVFTGVKPDLETPVAKNQHIGKFAVLLEPLPDGSTGPAVFSGIVTAPITLAHADHTLCDLAHDSFTLTSSFYGAAEIVKKYEWPADSDTWYAAVKIGMFVAPILDGVAQASIADGASGDVEILWGGDPSETIVAWNDHMAGGNAAGSGKDVMVYFHREKGRWSIKELEC